MQWRRQDFVTGGSAVWVSPFSTVGGGQRTAYQYRLQCILIRNWNNRHADTGNCCGGLCLGLWLNLRVASTAGQEGMSHTAPGVNFRQRSDHWSVVLSVYQRGSLLDGLAMYFSCDTKKFHDNVSTHILNSFWTSTHRGESSPLWRRHCRLRISMPAGLLTVPYCCAQLAASFINFLSCCWPSSGFYGAGKDNRGRRTENLSGRHPTRTIDATTLIIPPLLHWMPFLPQPSQFILARDRHWIILAFIAGGLVWNDIHQEISRDKNQQIKQHQTTDDTCLQIISRIEADLNWKYTQRSMQFYHSSYDI